VLFLLRDFALEFMQHDPSATASAGVAIIQIVVGALALIIATLIAAGFRMRTRPRQSNTPTVLTRLLSRIGSPWIAFLFGLVVDGIVNL